MMRMAGVSTMIKYCTKCVMPLTKPDLTADEEGVCSACRAYERRALVDWEARERELAEVFDRYRGDGSWYDCIIPVSGGKDSTFQTLTALKYGMTPLCVTGTTCDPSEPGRANLSNLQHLGVDHIAVTSDRQVRARLNRVMLETVGDISWPEHVSIFTMPVRVATQYRVPLIVWGENSQNEYGGPAAAQETQWLDRRWLEEFGGLLGMRVNDLLSMGFAKRDLIPFTYPTDAELREVGVTGIFLGYFLPWDGLHNAEVAKANGFKTFPGVVEGTICEYENLDNHQTGIHDYFKFLKYGFGRATDQACMAVRRGRMTRGNALWLVRAFDGQFPWTYLDKPVHAILKPLGMSIDRFIAVCDRFTNRSLFVCEDGRPVKDDEGNLTKVNYDNPC